MTDKPIFSEAVIKAAEELTQRFPFKPFYDEQVFDTCQVIQECVDKELISRSSPLETSEEEGNVRQRLRSEAEGHPGL